MPRDVTRILQPGFKAAALYFLIRYVSQNFTRSEYLYTGIGFKNRERGWVFQVLS